jgi:hypothetical protein
VIAQKMRAFAVFFTGLAIIEIEEGDRTAPLAEPGVLKTIQFRFERLWSPKNGLPDRFTLAGRRPYPHYLQ